MRGASLDTLQPDLAQRYRLVGAILAELRPATDAGRLQLLDLGAGTESLVEAVMPAWCDLQRADVDTFGRDDITLLEPGAPLPFADGAFDVVLALEVLEHVPAPERPRFLDECLRVSSRAVVLSTPLGTETTRRLESTFRREAERLTGQPVAFLEEHAAYGLPDPALTAAALQRRGAEVIALDNAPAAEWLIANLVDLTYAALFGQGEAKNAHNTEQNRALPTYRVGAAHYRRIYCASRWPDDLAALDRLIERQANEAPSLAPEELAEFAARRLTRVIRDLEDRHAHALGEKDARIGQLDGHASGLAQVIGGLKEGLEGQRQHITKLDALVASQAEAAAESERVLAEARAAEAQLRLDVGQLGDLQRQLKDLQAAQLTQLREGEEIAARLAAAEDGAARARGELEAAQRRLVDMQAARDEATARLAAMQETADQDAAESARLRRELSAVEESAGDERRHRERVARELANTTLLLWRAGEELLAVRQSTTWRLTRPMRQAVTASRALGLRAAVQWRRLRQRGKPVAAWPVGLSRRIVEASGLFDRAWYLAQYPDVAAAGLDPLDHFLASGASEGRRPTPLFDTSYYLSRYPDVPTSGINPLVHYILYGGREGRWVNSAFDSGYYLRTYVDVAASRLTPLAHFVNFGAAEGRHPSEEFDPGYYLATNQDVRDSGVPALEHFVLTGMLEGRHPRQMSAANPSGPAAAYSAPSADTYVPPAGLLPWFSPLNTVLDPSLASTPRLNVLVPGLGMRHMSGGPNTVLAFAGRLAAAGIPIRLVSTDAPVDEDPTPFWAHMTALAGGALPSGMELVDAHDRTVPWAVGEHDLFFASAWWTAQQARYAMRHTRASRFLYFIQDYEPLLHAASTSQALAEETYGLDYVPVVNTQLLADFLRVRGIGRFAEPAFANEAIVFEPALDRGLFHPAPRPDRARRRLLFYARPTNGLRNLFEMGVAALQQAVAQGVMPADQWEFVGMGEAFAATDLGHGAVLQPAPWLGLAGYAQQMRESDVLLSLMLSPHPSYPPLEMAACGGVSVTTVFGNKDAARLAEISPRIIGVPATIAGLVNGLVRAVTRPPGQHSSDDVKLPRSWDEAFSGVVPRAAAAVQRMMRMPLIEAADGTTSVFPGYRWPRQAYDLQRLDALARRQSQYRPPNHPLLFSLVTTVWNTPAEYLEACITSVLQQDCGDIFEWVLLDNGTTNADTRAVMRRHVADPRIRARRVEANLGIIGGLHACLTDARGRYVVPLDSDDLLTPDCLRVLASLLQTHGYPPLAYSDEDKIDGAGLRDPYFKPDWDPVLFAHSCYTSHVCALDREHALSLGSYTDPATEGSHDWDSFVRFYSQGLRPTHVPEVLYTWRMHEESTSGNIHAKPYVVESQRSVLRKFIAGARPAVPCEVVPSDLFPGTPDWRLLTPEVPPVVSVVIGPSAEPLPRVAREHGDVTVVEADTAHGLIDAARLAHATGALLHLVARGLHVDEPSWAREARSLMALFPDAVVVGGVLLHAGRVIDGARLAGIGRGLDSVDVGRYAHDPGYFAQVWKPHTVDAVPGSHLVVDPTFLLAVIERLPADVLASPARLGPWLGVAAARQARRVVYSPFLRASVPAGGNPAGWGDSEPGLLQGLADRIGTRSLWSRHLAWSRHGGIVGRDPAVASRPLSGPDLSVPSYSAWLAGDRTARRLLAAAAPTTLPTIAVLTSVWIRTPADLLAETVSSVLAQTQPPTEWIILRNGPVTPEVEAELDRAAAADFVRIIDEAVNAGIIGAMRLCLGAATADYVLPLDADDLLESDALEVLGRWAAAHDADLLFSDEDLLSGGMLDHPFLRPGYDAVLNAEAAYVWHACLVRRARAVEVGAYQDRAAEYCHDWDTLLRIAAGSGRIVHVPHLLYHWRTHAASHSNSGEPHPGTLASTQAVLARTVAALPAPERYQVVAFPRHRGIKEWCIERVPVEAPPLAHVHVRRDTGAPAPSSPRLSSAFPVVAETSVTTGPSFPQALLAVLDGLPVEALVCVTIGEVAEIADGGLWDAVKLLEIHPEVQVVGGRLVDLKGTVLEAGSVFIDQGAWMEPFAGTSAADPGPYALALKAHRIDIPCTGLFVVRGHTLRSVLERTHVDDTTELASALAALLLAHDRWVAYTPLLEGLIHQGGAPVPTPMGEAESLATLAKSMGHDGPLPVRHGAAALAVYRLRRGLS